MLPGISLADKCQLLFGCAVIVILAGALSVPWLRFRAVIEESQIEAARHLADAWYANSIALGTYRLQADGLRRVEDLFPESDATPAEVQALRMGVVWVTQIEPEGDADPFLVEALERFRADAERLEHSRSATIGGRSVYRYARPLRESDLRDVRDPAVSEFSAHPFDPEVADPIRAMLIIDRASQFAAGQLLLNRVYIVVAGLVAGLLAVLVFYLILKKLILSPVRQLRRTSEKVQAGDLAARSQIRTGDEFEELSGAFNSMLDQVQQGEARLRRINETLDLKVSELAEANIGLFESNRLKSEFLANVSHELRTPLNSIIGFTELLDELARHDDGADPKRLRYLQNILSSGRSLLEMINDLLDMAKIEAGRVELSIEPTSASDLVEGLATILRPQAAARGIELRTQVARNLPVVETDPGKLQQILYNFLSNAIKFSPEGEVVTISGDRVTRQDNKAGLRLAVSDRGPGIPYDMQDVIFEKFRQVDASHTREHAGTGLGLAICRDLAGLLGATVSLVSEPGEGATFFVDLPLTYEPDEAKPLMA